MRTEHEIINEEKQFLKNNQDILRRMFERRINNLKELVFTIPAGEERDRVILLVQELKAWLGVLLDFKRKRKKDKNPDFI